MQITANTMAEGNAGSNIGAFLQIIQSMGAGQSSASGSNVMNSGAGGAAGNPFSQILLQQIAMLLQTGGIELSDASVSKEELASALQNLLEGNQAGTDGAFSGLALLAMAGQQILQNVENQSMLSSGETSDVTGETGAARQLTSFIGQAIQGNQGETTSKGNDQTSVKTGVLGSADAATGTLKEGTQKDVAVSAKAGTEFTVEIENLLKNSDSNVDRNNISGLKEESLSKTNYSAQAPIEAKTTLSSQESVKDVAAGQIDVKLKNISTEAQGGKSAIENASVESQMSKAGVNVKTVIPEQAEGEHSQILNAAAGGQDEAKKASTATDGLHNDSKTEVFGRDSKYNMAGKDGNQNVSMTLESQAAADKLKPELKSKAVTTERNSDNNYLNSTTTSAGVQTKPETGDTSSTSIINRVASEFRENLMSEGGRVKITLTPPSLGSLEMDVSVVNNKVKVMLIADSKDVQKILSGNIETLKTTLQTQGLTIERCDVMMQDSRDEYPQGFSGQQAFGQEQAFGERNSRTQAVEDESVKKPSVVSVQAPVRRPLNAGSESISLFA